MSGRIGLVLWDSALLVGVALFFLWNIQPHSNFIVGFATILILTTCIRNHIAVYKLTGKIY